MIRFSKHLICALFVGLMFTIGAQAADFHARLASLDPPTTAKHRGLLKAAELIKERTDGHVVITVYPSSQLGNAGQTTQAVQLGSLDAVINPTAFLGGFDPAASIFDIPYLFPTDFANHPNLELKLLNGPFGKAVLETFQEHKFVPICFWYGGFKVVSSNKPVASVQDFAGQRFRVMNSKILTQQFAALDASAIPLPFGELYTSLQNGVVNGQENPLDIIQRMKFYEVQKNILVSNHGAIVEVILFSPAFWKKLPAKYQEIIRNAFLEVAPEEAKGKLADAEKALEFLKKAGLNVRAASPAEEKHLHDKMYPAGRDAYIAMAGTEGQKLIKLYNEQMKLLAK
jgi:tripartite ATP-independent transporter DctP family solute receptor